MELLNEILNVFNILLEAFIKLDSKALMSAPAVLTI